MRMILLGPLSVRGDALAAGTVDDFNQADSPFGLSQAEAELEGPSDFAKEVMVKYGVPTAAYGTFSDFERQLHIEKQGAPIVVKADACLKGAWS